MDCGFDLHLMAAAIPHDDTPPSRVRLVVDNAPPPRALDTVEGRNHARAAKSWAAQRNTYAQDAARYPQGTLAHRRLNAYAQHAHLLHLAFAHMAAGQDAREYLRSAEVIERNYCLYREQEE